MVVIFRVKKMMGFFFFIFQVDFKEVFWVWINEVFILGIYGIMWYNDQLFMVFEGYIESREVFLVGMLRFKQVRVKEGK